MKFFLLAFALSVAAPVLAQIGNPTPWPLPYPHPFPDDRLPTDFCLGADLEEVTALTRRQCEAKAESWGAGKNVECKLTRVKTDYCQAMCKNDDGSNFARLRMYLDTTCGMRWGNSSRLRTTKILYYRQ